MFDSYSLLEVVRPLAIAPYKKLRQPNRYVKDHLANIFLVLMPSPRHPTPRRTSVAFSSPSVLSWPLSTRYSLPFFLSIFNPPHPPGIYGCIFEAWHKTPTACTPVSYPAQTLELFNRTAIQLLVLHSHVTFNRNTFPGRTAWLHEAHHQNILQLARTLRVTSHLSPLGDRSIILSNGLGTASPHHLGLSLFPLSIKHQNLARLQWIVT